MHKEYVVVEIDRQGDEETSEIRICAEKTWVTSAGSATIRRQVAAFSLDDANATDEFRVSLDLIERLLTDFHGP